MSSGREADAPRWRLKVTPTARRQGAAAAAVEFCHGAVLASPQRVGKRLQYQPYKGMYCARRGDYRVIYAIDEATPTVTVHAIAHHGEAYRAR